MLRAKGIIAAMITPITENGELNEPVLRWLVNFLIDGKVHGLFPLGTNGEFWAFDFEEKRQIFEIVKSETKGRMPIYGGTSAITTREVIRLTRMAEEVGLDAVSILTPYFISLSQEELYRHYKNIADATSLPILLYSNKDRTGLALMPETVSRLAAIPNIIGLKDSNGNLALTSEYVQRVPEGFSILMGNDALILAGLTYRCQGAVAATANVVPGLVVSIYENFKQGNYEAALQAQEALAPLRRAFSFGSSYGMLKEALIIRGINAGRCREPYIPLNSQHHQELAAILDEIAANPLSI